MLRMTRPRTSTLFPYTTLFRSADLGDRSAHFLRGRGHGLHVRSRVVGSRGGRLDLIVGLRRGRGQAVRGGARSEEHTSELQSLRHLVCRLLLEKKKERTSYITT